MDYRKMTLKGAFLAGPGPDSIKSAVLLAAKGLCMGAADIIPGVSGGTIALITGIYTNLIRAIKSFDSRFVKLFVTGAFTEALAGLHLKFLLPLFTGIAVAVVSLARVMHYLLQHQPIPTWSLFFGLIAASIWLVGRQVPNWRGGTIAAFGAGTVAAYLLVSLIPINTPQDAWFIFGCGMVAICAMILPGISGAFILLILGKYEFITATLKNPFVVDNIQIILIFGTGCVIGLAGFSRVLNYLLTRHNALTLAFLTGLMTGSMRKIWPWKTVLESKVIRGKLHVISDQPVLPETFNADLVGAVSLMLAGFFAVMLLHRVAHPRKP